MDGGSVRERENFKKNLGKFYGDYEKNWKLFIFLDNFQEILRNVYGNYGKIVYGPARNFEKVYVTPEHYLRKC